MFVLNKLTLAAQLSDLKLSTSFRIDEKIGVRCF